MRIHVNSDSIQKHLERAIEITIVAAIYYAAARLGLLLAFEKTNASPIWPPSGIAFAAVILRGPRIWPGILLGAFLANLTVFLHNQVGSTWVVFAVSLLIAAGNTAEALVGGFLIRHRNNHPEVILDRAHDVFKFVIVALLMCMTSASVAATTLCASGLNFWSMYPKIWFTWWLGDTASVLVIAPLILTWNRLPRPRLDVARISEATISLILVGAIGWVSFGLWPFAQATHYPLVSLIIPLLLWPTFRFGQRGAVAALFLIAVIAIGKTLHGDGPFVQKTLHQSLLLLVGFIAVVTTTVLAIAAVLTEREEAEASLKKTQEKLEARVQEQTADLRRTTDILRKKSEDLSRSNSELNQFAFVASHDLQAPLRKIISFGNLLRDHVAGVLDPEAQDYLHRMRRSAERMEKLIQDLLALAQVTTKAKPHEKIDLAVTAQEVISDLEAMVTQLGAHIKVGFLPQLNGDPLQMRQLLQNLIANALKFHKKEEPPRVIICGRYLNNGFCEITVEDNGIGFEEQYLDKILKPFQRLHSWSEYEGSGIGLTICDKIVLRHGGTISAKSSLGKGSRFIITLPTPYEGVSSRAEAVV